MTLARRLFPLPLPLVLPLAVVVAGCQRGTQDGPAWGDTTDATSDDATSGSGPGATAGPDETDGADGADGADTGPRFDVANPDGGSVDPDGTDGCQKIDFLFVVDNSVSMIDEQEALVQSFPGFISGIEDTAQAHDFHIMAVDTDAGGGDGGQSCIPDPGCCDSYCATHPGSSCNGKQCPGATDPCDVTLGAGRTISGVDGTSCGLPPDRRFIVDGDPDVDDMFSCAAGVGNKGDDNERPMEALGRAVVTEAGAGGCNEGFVRDDAILVVTILTDERGDEEYIAGLKDELVTAKGGNEEAIVVLAMTGHDGCGYSSGEQIQAFAESFPFGQWGSICENDYAPFFVDAISVIDAACDIFTPEG